METYRLTRIPVTSSLDNGRQLIPQQDRSLIKEPISLASSVYDGYESGKVSTITFSRTPSFAPSKVDCRLGELVELKDDTAASVRIDSVFDGITPLLGANPELPTVDVVACTGLGGRAFGSWQHEDGSMWLRDFLGRDIPGIRVFIWGYRSKLVDNKSHAGILDFRDNFLDDLKRIRRTYSERRQPLILVGHSLGGLVIKAAFIKGSQEKALSALYDAMYGFVFFGTPHDGIYTEAWLDLFGNQPPQNLIRDLTPGSTILREMKEAFRRTREDIDVITCIERGESPSTRRTEDGQVSRDGEPQLMVTEVSSRLYHPRERCVVINSDHSKIAKLSDNDGSPYHTIKDHLKDIVEIAHRTVGSRMHKGRLTGILLGIESFIDTALKPLANSGEQLLFLAEKSDLSAIRDIIVETEDFISDRLSSNIFDAGERLYNVFHDSVLAASANEPKLRKSLGEIDSILWLESTGPLGKRAVINVEYLVRLANEAIPAIIDLKESLALVVSDVGPSVLEGLILGPPAKHLGLDFVARKQSLLEDPPSKLQGPLLGHLEKVDDSGPTKHGLKFGKYLSENGNLIELVVLENREYGLNLRGISETKARARELATLLAQFAFNQEEAGTVRQLLKPTMFVFDCMGYIEETAEEQLVFVYRLPRQFRHSTNALLQHSRTLESWIMEGRQLQPRLEERYSLAYSICHTVFNLHICGWVHKSIRPKNIVLLPQQRNPGASFSDRHQTYEFVPYLKGFEFSRKQEALSGRFPSLDDENDIYRHPNRQREPKENFHQIHDVYAVGTVLLEIGTGKSVKQLLKSFEQQLSDIENTDIRAGKIQEGLVRIAERDLPTTMGTRYSICVMRCLEGDFGVLDALDDEYDTDLTLTFRRLVVDDLRRMASSCAMNI